jgi:hypothetical protein
MGWRGLGGKLALGWYQRARGKRYSVWLNVVLAGGGVSSRYRDLVNVLLLN